jgi:hypothetical protein
VVNLAVVQASGDACVDGPPPELAASTVNLATGAAAAQRHASVVVELPAGHDSDPPDRHGFGATAIPTSEPTFRSATAGPAGCDASSPAAGQPSRTASTAPIPDSEPFVPVEPYALMQRGVSSAVCEALARTLSGSPAGSSEACPTRSSGRMMRTTLRAYIAPASDPAVASRKGILRVGSMLGAWLEIGEGRSPEPVLQYRP